MDDSDYEKNEKIENVEKKEKKAEIDGKENCEQKSL